MVGVPCQRVLWVLLNVCEGHVSSYCAAASTCNAHLALVRGLKLELLCAGSFTGDAKPGLGCAKTMGLLS